jgi:hypothetical protein
MFKCTNCKWKGEKEELTDVSKGAMWNGKCPICGDNVQDNDGNVMIAPQPELSPNFGKNLKKKPKKEKVEEPKELDFDIDNDGDVDEDDISLIAKKLGSRSNKSKPKSKRGPRRKSKK